MKKYKIINRKRFYVFVIISIYLCFSLFSLFKSYSIAENTYPIKYQEIYVEKGDTLWDIALKYKPIKDDVRDMVAEIRNFNKMDSLIIMPGDIIKIPLRKK